MSRDIYPSMTAATAVMEKINYIANNLSNTNTVGYRARKTSFENVIAKEGFLGDSYVQLSEPKLSDRDGGLIIDNVDTHFALRGKGFFVVESTGGEELLTRSGNFQLDSNGQLVNSLGEIVMGDSGPIRFEQDQKYFSVTPEGAVIDDFGSEIGRLKVVEGVGLDPLEGQRFRAKETVQLEMGYEVVQGAVENSNVDSFQVMMDLIKTSRNFETFQKSMGNSKELDMAMINSVKRSR